jgi:hypothetical protein
MAQTHSIYEKSVQDRTGDGHTREVAVGCWFTSTGRSIPKLIKYRDADGSLRLLRDIQILYAEQTRSAGRLSQRYDCRTRLDGRELDFTLLYQPLTNSWHMIV